MKGTFPAFPALLAFLLLTPAGCSDRASILTPEVAHAMALAQRIRAQTGGDSPGVAALAGILDAPKVTHRSPDTLDPTPLITEGDVIAILQQRSACGDATATAVWKVTKEKLTRPECRGTGTGTTACKVKWMGARPGETSGAEGCFVITVVDVQTFEMFQHADTSTTLPGIGDDAYLIQGQPYVRVGDLALTIENSSSSALSADVLKAASKRMPK